MMETGIYVGNRSSSTRRDDLNVLFSQAGDVTSIDIVKDLKRGTPNGFACITTSAQSEADKAVSMFNVYVPDDHDLRVLLLRPRKQRGSGKI